MNRPMNKIGFAISGEGEMRTPREFDHDYRMDEMAYRKGGEHMTGYGGIFQLYSFHQGDGR